MEDRWIDAMTCCKITGGSTKGKHKWLWIIGVYLLKCLQRVYVPAHGANLLSANDWYIMKESPALNYHSPRLSIMATKETQTSPSPSSTWEAAHDSTSLRTMFDDGDTYDVPDALESNMGSAESKSDKEKESLIVDWDGPNDPAWRPISLLRVCTGLTQL